jgi:NAD(P)-dependent dehydrogenase (short-subunit alcohol dehydrogenase family)
MTDVVVITGGAGGMGLATAKLTDPGRTILLTDVSQERLDSAVAELTALGLTAESRVADVTDPTSVAALAVRAAELGTVKAVIHTAGVSPQMGGSEFIIRINALGTVNIANAFLPRAGDGFVLVNVASIAGHFLPSLIVPTRAFPLASTDPDRFLKRLVSRSNNVGRKQSAGLAYGLSKAFVIWYTRNIAEAFGAKGARVISVSPGSFDTSMGRLEEKSGSGNLLKVAALKRHGRPEEVAELLDFLSSGRAAYITGTDILIDGGTKAGVEKHGRKSLQG